MPECDPLPEVALGRALGTTIPEPDEDAFCPAELTGEGIPVTDETGVANRTGASGNPIRTPLLQAMAYDTIFPKVMVQNASGVWFVLSPNTTSEKFALISQNSGFQLQRLDGIPCFDPDGICECDPEQIAGWKEIDGRLCLVRFNASGDSDIWEDTNTVNIQGAGTAGSPFSASVKISADPGNILEARADGLYAALS